MNKQPVAVLGATGMVGQRMLALLESHPWFEPVYLGASSRSEGKSYEDAAPWRLASEPPKSILSKTVKSCNIDDLPKDIRLVFSALDRKVAGQIEANAAKSGRFVVSNASSWRSDPNTPLIIPEVNPDHLQLLGKTPSSGIITNPNCCAIPLSMALAPLQADFGVEAVCVSTYQAVSGAGYPGESAWDMVGNVHPHPGAEEEKLASEPNKILGSPRQSANIAISARCVRVPTADGHLLGVQAKLKTPVSPAQVEESMRNWKSACGPLPSSPIPLLKILNRRDRPAPRFDVMAGNGMAVSIGRIESCPVMGIKFFALAHNTIRGAAGAAIANGELLHISSLL